MTEPSHNGANSAAKPVLVSVVIPAYKCADYIVATLKSVMAQSFTNYEVIVVNDGSPDTDVLERELRPYLASIRYVRQENGGPSSARNRGVQESRGSYVAFLDSDDLWLPNHLANQVEQLQKNTALVLVYSDSLLLRDDVPFATAFEKNPQVPPVTFESLVAETCSIGTSTTVVSRQAALDAGGFELGRHRSEDFDLWLRIAHRGGAMGYSSTVQVCHRVANGLSCDNTAMNQAQISVYEKLFTALTLTPAQSKLLRNKIAEMETRLQIGIAKDSLLKDQFPQALAAVQQANSILKNRKLSVATVGLKLFPRFFGKSYKAYLQYLEQRESTRLADFYKKQNGSHSSEGSKVGYETFAEIANEAPSWAKVGK
jgi:glycosyltransferase involved in cell wall biosynthesis